MFFLEHAWYIPLIPAASFFLILFFGKRMPKKGAEIGIAALGISFALAVATNIQWRDHVNDAERRAESVHTEEPATVAEEGPVAEEHLEFDVEPVHKTWTWWSNGDIDFTAGMLLDGPGVMMLFVVTLISLLVHVYSTDYVGGDRRYTHYFAFLSLFPEEMKIGTQEGRVHDRFFLTGIGRTPPLPSAREALDFRLRALLRQ